MTAVNLAAPGNEQLALETQCQKKAERERVRYWLNEYRNQV